MIEVGSSLMEINELVRMRDLVICLWGIFMSDHSPQLKGGDHFDGKEVIQHVVERQAQGFLDASESHGTEMPGHISAAADAAKECSIGLLLLWVVLTTSGFRIWEALIALAVFGLGWLLWKAGRAAFLGWSRLERLHRVMEQERYEIQHHREQERSELRVLYRAKGFEGRLLDEVIDVLMADGDRLLRVMLEEELGLRLGNQEHPLKQAVGAAVGSVVALGACLGAAYFMGNWGVVVGALVISSLAAALAANYEGNRVVPAMVWTAGLGVLVYFSGLFFMRYLLG